jgi:hypothetical protein
MSARHLAGRRKKYLVGLPKDATIPKFLRPSEIERAKEIARENPDTPWSQVLDQVVCSSFPDLKAVLAT